MGAGYYFRFLGILKSILVYHCSVTLAQLGMQHLLSFLLAAFLQCLHAVFYNTLKHTKKTD